MKVPPKRKGNGGFPQGGGLVAPSMKVPPKRKGNSSRDTLWVVKLDTLNESPSEKEGKCLNEVTAGRLDSYPSMKVPPKRKGNAAFKTDYVVERGSLNESPSEKEGKSVTCGF